MLYVKFFGNDLIIFVFYSSRRRRSSDTVFSDDMVHILPGYPMQSPDNPQVALLAFFLQLFKDFSGTVVNRDLLKAIVKSDMSGIGGSMGSTVLSVQPLSPTTESPTDEDKGDDESMSGFVVIGAPVGGVLLLVIIGALVLGFKRSNK